MRHCLKFLILLTALLGPALSSAQTPEGYDVFVPISKYIVQGNYESLSAWFADNVDISVLSRDTDASRTQAKLIVKSFFETYTPKSFEITHTAGRANMKYVLGYLNAGGETFLVTIFVTVKDGQHRIQQFRIERT